MGTFPLHLRHIAERAMSEKIQAQLDRDLGIERSSEGGVVTRSRPGGDARALRGIPVVGVPGGLSGAVLGSEPWNVR